MAFTKNLISAILALGLLAALAESQSHHFTMGNRQPGDRLMYQENIVKTSKFMQIVTAQKVFNVTNNFIITQINAWDGKTNGNGAYASLLKGGVGYNFAELKFKSKRGHGINFSVQIYAKPHW